MKSFWFDCTKDLILSSKDYVPELGTHSKSSMLTSIMVLVVVLLQSMEIGLGVPARIKEVQEIVSAIVHYVPY
jgi:hypothetical protein